MFSSFLNYKVKGYYKTTSNEYCNVDLMNLLMQPKI